MNTINYVFDAGLFVFFPANGAFETVSLRDDMGYNDLNDRTEEEHISDRRPVFGKDHRHKEGDCRNRPSRKRVLYRGRED